MIPWRLVAANLFRHPIRTALTFLSLVIAFLLFMLLNAITSAFSGGVSLQGAQRLIVDSKYSMMDNLPVPYLEQIRSFDGVQEATNINWFGGYYKDPKETFPTLAIDPAAYFSIYSEYNITEATLNRFEAVRTGAVVSGPLAERYGWNVGDRIVLRGDIWPLEDGTWDWEFELVGTFESSGNQLTESLFLIRYDYFNDAVVTWAKDQLGMILLQISADQHPETVAAAIDRRYENSSDPTRTASEDQYTRQFVSQLGDIGLMSTVIMSAVFFTIVLLTGNTASQTFRERVPELAAMKTLGFTDLSVSALVFSEALILCVLGGCSGIFLSLVLEPRLNLALGDILGSFSMSLDSVVVGILLSALIGLIIGAQPAWLAKRLKIVDALRER